MVQLPRDERIIKSKRLVACETECVLTGCTHSLLNSVAYWQGEYRPQCIKGTPSISIQRCLQSGGSTEFWTMAAYMQVKTTVANLAARGLRELSDPAMQLGVSVRSSCCNQRPKHLKRRKVDSDSYTRFTVSEGSSHPWLERRTHWDRVTKS